MTEDAPPGHGDVSRLLELAIAAVGRRRRCRLAIALVTAAIGVAVVALAA